MATDMNKHIWEGWTVGMFISELAPTRGDDNDRTELAETLHLEGRACRMVQGESAFLQETYPGCE